MKHWAIFLSNNANKQFFIQQLLNKKATGELQVFNEKEGALFSDITIKAIIEEEEMHEHVEVATVVNRNLKTLSGGEQKKALLAYLLSKKPGYIILDNPLDNLDIASQASFPLLLEEVATDITLIQLIHRKKDILPFIQHALSLEADNSIHSIDNIATYIEQSIPGNNDLFSNSIPPPLHEYPPHPNPLIRLTNVSVSYEGRPIVKNISWEINKGEFWQLIGPNGSGKTTLLSMIIGDNPKAYGEDIMLFGRKKGSGESVWEIKDKIGYFTPSMTDLFSRLHSTGQMILSGFFDSIGLYNIPSDLQLQLALQWLQVMGMAELRSKPFYKLSTGQQRMVLIARAMVKHPPLLILDEPTAGLDDHNAGLVTSLVNKIAAESNTTLLYVSHRTEPGLTPTAVFELTPSANGSSGVVREHS